MLNANKIKTKNKGVLKGQNTVRSFEERLRDSHA